MAAVDAFEYFNTTLSPHDREVLKDLIDRERADFLAARSEDERVRIVREYVAEVHEILKQGKRT